MGRVEFLLEVDIMLRLAETKDLKKEINDSAFFIWLIFPDSDAV